MGKTAREQLSRALNEHLNNIHETFQMLDQTPPSSLEKVSWKEVIQIGEQVSKQATNVGMLYTGEIPGVKVLEENMASYFNVLQGFLLLSHGSTINAGTTLSSCIHKAVKQVVDSSFVLLREAVSSYGSNSKSSNLSIPQLVGVVSESCSALNKTPTSNITAIGRAMTQVAVSIKDVLREMNELKPSNNESSDNVSSVKAEEAKSDEDDASCDEDLGNDLSQEEMKVVQLTKSIVSEVLLVIKELIRSITSLLHRENSGDSAISVDSLEKLLKLSQGVGVQVDELGACLYPPQEISAIRVATEKISNMINDIESELGSLKGQSDDFVKACIGLRTSLKLLESEVGCCVADSNNYVVSQLENLVVSN